MQLRRRLALELAERHPDEAAGVFESLPAEDAAAFVESLPVETTAGVLERATSHPAAAILAAMDPRDAGHVVSLLPVDFAAGYLRRLTAGPRNAILAELEPGRRRSLGAMLRYPEHTAGALMDPEVLALPVDLHVSDAIERVRRSADHARYNVYVVDRDDKLVGVLNLRELLIARPSQPLSEIMHTSVIRVPAETGLRGVLDHPGWREVHALPVVDADGTYLGAVRYRTLRRLEAERAPAAHAGAMTAQALGDLFQVGISGALEAMAAAEPSAGRRAGS